MSTQQTYAPSMLHATESLTGGRGALSLTAPVVGVSHEQVRQDAGVKDLTPAVDVSGGDFSPPTAVDVVSGEVASGYPEPQTREAAPEPLTLTHTRHRPPTRVGGRCRVAPVRRG